MALPVLTDWDLTVSLDDALRTQGLAPADVMQRTPHVIDVVESVVALGNSLVKPVVYYRRLSITDFGPARVILTGGGRLDGSRLATYLAQASEVVVAVCTIGEELDRLVSRSLAQDPVWALCLDGVGTAAIELLSDAAWLLWRAWAAEDGLNASSPLSPGTSGWPVGPGQRDIFALLEPEAIGVRVESSGMMYPLKSISQVTALGSQVDPSLLRCDLCGGGGRCGYPWRKSADNGRPAQPRNAVRFRDAFPIEAVARVHVICGGGQMSIPTRPPTFRERRQIRRCCNREGG